MRKRPLPAVDKRLLLRSGDDRLLPGLLPFFSTGVFGNLLIQLFLCRRQFFDSSRLLRRWHFQRWRFGIRVGRRIEERIKLIVLVLCNWVELMRVAFGTSDCQRHPDQTGGIEAIFDLFVAKLIRLDAAFRIDQRIAMESGGDTLSLNLSRILEQIAGELFDRKLIKRQIAVERLNHPVPIRPDGSFIVVLSVAIGIAACSGQNKDELRGVALPSAV